LALKIFIKEIVMRKILVVLSIITSPLLIAQIQINPNGAITPEQAIQDVLLGAGINAFNITYNASAANAGNVQQSVQEFDASATAFPISNGIHMTSQNAPAITDADLSSIVAGQVTNGVVIEFDFIPDGSLITFNYIFASSEYSSYTCSQFNDGFGFFISGPGINGTFTNNAINIATVPGTNVPVAINTVNSGSPSGFNDAATCAAADPNWQANAQYFTTSNNAIFTSSVGITNYNGSSTLLPASVNVQCNEVYHIKLAICNVVDQILDSGVFLEAGSFQSDAVDISISAGNAFSDTLIYRNCSEGVISFERLSCDLNQELIVYLETDGSAVPGVDFVELPDSVVFESGQTNLDVSIVPLEGGENPVPETIDVTAYFINGDGDTITATGTIWIVDPPVPEFEASITEYQCHSDSLPISASVTVNTFPEYTFSWSDGDTTWTPGIEEDTLFFVDIHENGTYFYEVTLTDGCGSSWIDTAVIVMNETLSIDSVYSIPTPCGLQEGAVVAQVSGITGVLAPEWSGPGTDSTAGFFNATVWQDLSSGWYYFTAEDDVCQKIDSVFVDIEEPPVANVTVNPELGYSPLTVTFSNESENANNYYWSFPNGTDLSTNSMDSQTQTYDTIPGTYTVMLVAYQDGCQDTAYASFIILELIPDPEVETPNTFTPNGDGANDLWVFTKLEFVENIQLYVFNRWGNLVYEEFSPAPTWDGRDLNGAELGEGVYFYRYEATGQNGQELEGHGFIQLHRK
jgi:gliding motility-associated-like protein